MFRYINLTHLSIYLMVYGLVFSVNSFSLDVGNPLTYQDPKQSSGEVIGRILIPAIDLDEIVREGASQSIVDMGVAQWAGTAKFGKPGNTALFGHRTIKTRPFFKIGELGSLDEIFVRDMSGNWFLYKAYEKFYVDGDNHEFLVDPPRVVTSMLTLVACHPLYSDAQRIVIRAELMFKLSHSHDDGPMSHRGKTCPEVERESPFK